MEQLAKVAGYKNKNVARVMWRPVFKKLKDLTGMEAGDDTPHGLKRKAQTCNSGDAGSDRAAALATPRNAKRGRKALPSPPSTGYDQRRDVLYADDGRDDDDFDINPTPSKKPATNKSRGLGSGAKGSGFASANDSAPNFEPNPNTHAATSTAAAADGSMDTFEMKKEKTLQKLGLMDDGIGDDFDLSLMFNHDVKTEDYQGGDMLGAFYQMGEPVGTGDYAEDEA